MNEIKDFFGQRFEPKAPLCVYDTSFLLKAARTIEIFVYALRECCVRHFYFPLCTGPKWE